MSIKIDLANQVRQTVLPQWKPLLPLFEAVMNSLQAIKDAKLPKGTGMVTIGVFRETGTLLSEKKPSQTPSPFLRRSIQLHDELLAPVPLRASLEHDARNDHHRRHFVD